MSAPLPTQPDGRTTWVKITREGDQCQRHREAVQSRWKVRGGSPGDLLPPHWRHLKTSLFTGPEITRYSNKLQTTAGTTRMRVAGIFGISAVAAQQITLQTCLSAPYETFKVNADLTIAAPGGQCIGISGGDVMAVPCTGGADQKWTWLSNGCVSSVAGASRHRARWFSLEKESPPISCVNQVPFPVT